LQADGVQSRQTLFVRYCPISQRAETRSGISLFYHISAAQTIDRTADFSAGISGILLRQHHTKLVRKVRCQIFRQIA
ncbi:hypothetical protein, partial [Ruminococcus callidus]|uniref:hypothetical protein n=1 Tax=Ruminococcus callidus TaxID=40519 RepID=UPI0023F4ED83